MSRTVLTKALETPFPLFDRDVLLTIMEVTVLTLHLEVVRGRVERR